MTGARSLLRENPALAYIAPFIAFLASLPLGRIGPVGPEITYPIRFVVVLGVLLLTSRAVIPYRVSRFWGSALLGVVVFVIWIGPDLLWPAYRQHWLFQNSLTGQATSAISESARSNLLFVIIRVLGSVALVPVIEELFWRGWMMRWLIRNDFWTVPVGAYTAASFWIVALLFASEHGPFWDVGLITGLIYNWWIVRTKSLGDCVLAHAVTNGCLAAYVLAANRWQYWL